MTMRMSIPIDQPATDNAAGRAFGRWLRLFQIELRRSPAIWAALAIAGITAWLMWDQLPVGVVRWTQVSSTASHALFPVSGIAAGIGAFIATRDERLRLGEQLAQTGVGQARRDALALATATVWCAAAYLVPVGGFFIYAAMRATWGGPMWGQVILPLATIVPSVAGGWLVGTLFRHRLGVIVAVGAALGVHALYPLTWRFRTGEREMPDGSVYWVSSDAWYRNLLPMEVLDFAHLASVVGLSVVWLLGMAGVFLALSWWWRHRLPQALGAAALAAMVAVMGAVPLAMSQPEPWYQTIASRQAPPVCEARLNGQIEVCLHPEDLALMDETGAVIERLMAPIAGIPGIPTRFGSQVQRQETGTVGIYVYDETDLEFHVTASVMRELMSGPNEWVPFQTGPAEYVMQAWLLEQAGISPEEATSQGYLAPIPAVQAIAEARAAGVTDPMELNQYLYDHRNQGDTDAFRAEIEAAIDRFSALSPEEQRSWLEANWPDLRAGELTLEDLP